MAEFFMHFPENIVIALNTHFKQNAQKLGCLKSLTIIFSLRLMTKIIKYYILKTRG